MRSTCFSNSVVLGFSMALLGWLVSEIEAAETMTVAAAFGEEAKTTERVPQFKWLKDGMAILYDQGVDKEQRTFNRLDPASGEQVAALNMDAALKSLAESGSSEIPEVLGWPEGFSDSGERAVYQWRGDYFVLELESARFTRVTDTQATEVQATFSPDGEKLAYVRDSDLYVYDLIQNAEKRLTLDGSDTRWNGLLSANYRFDVFWGLQAYFKWSPDSAAIAYLQSDVSKVTEFLYYDIEPFKPRVYRQRYAQAGEDIAVVRVGIVELATAKTTWIQRTGVVDEYVHHLDWLVDSSRVAVQIMNRTADRLDLYFADCASGKSTHILQETNTAWVNNRDDIYFLKDNRRFIWGSERSGYNHLYLYTLDGELLNPITQGEWQVRGPAQVRFWFGQGVVAIDEANEWVFYTSLEKSAQERQLYRIGYDGKNKTQVTRADGYHNVSASQDARYFVDNFSTLATPPALSLHRTDGRKIAQLSESNLAFVGRYEMLYPKLFAIPADDGFQMPAMMTLPRDFDPNKRYPVIIGNYGGPQAPKVVNQWSQSFVAYGVFFAQVMADLGYIQVTFDNRSATALSKATENTIVGQMEGENELQDVLAGIRWLKSQRYVDPDRVGMWGHSYGAGLTLMTMTESQEIAAGIAIAGVTDHRYHAARFTEFAMKMPANNKESYDKTSRVLSAKNLHGRLLIMHGLNDDNVRPQNTWAFVDALVDAGIDFEMMIYPMEGHGINGPKALVHRFNKMVQFWQNNL